MATVIDEVGKQYGPFTVERRATPRIDSHGCARWLLSYHTNGRSEGDTNRFWITRTGSRLRTEGVREGVRANSLHIQAGTFDEIIDKATGLPFSGVYEGYRGYARNPEVHIDQERLPSCSRKDDNNVVPIRDAILPTPEPNQVLARARYRRDRTILTDHSLDRLRSLGANVKQLEGHRVRLSGAPQEANVTAPKFIDMADLEDFLHKFRKSHHKLQHQTGFSAGVTSKGLHDCFSLLLTMSGTMLGIGEHIQKIEGRISDAESELQKVAKQDKRSQLTRMLFGSGGRNE